MQNKCGLNRLHLVAESADLNHQEIVVPLIYYR